MKQVDTDVEIVETKSLEQVLEERTKLIFID